MERRTIFLEDDVTPESISDVGSRMLFLQTESSEPITLLINSGGGDLYPALQLCEQMKIIMKAPVRGIAVGECASSATFIMLHCAERYGTPYSRFLVHSGNLGGIDVPIGRASREVAEQLLADIKATEEQVTNLYIDHLTPAEWKAGEVDRNEKRQFVQKLIDRGDQRFNGWLSAEEAVHVGLIEDVYKVKLDIY